MLAMPDLDVLDALGCDCVVIANHATNAFVQTDFWHPYDFNGRLPSLVHNTADFQTQSDGSILQNGISRMVTSPYMFDEAHGGQPVDWMGDLPMLDLKEYKQQLESTTLSDQQIRARRAWAEQFETAVVRPGGDL